MTEKQAISYMSCMYMYISYMLHACKDQAISCLQGLRSLPSGPTTPFEICWSANMGWERGKRSAQACASCLYKTCVQLYNLVHHITWVSAHEAGLTIKFA